MACSVCDNVVVTIHCKAQACTWQRCVKCRAFGPQGGIWTPYLNAVSIEQLYAMDPIRPEARSPQLPTVGDSVN